ncbi:MAG: CRISPR-associated protein Csx11 [Chloroflexi bacterium]|nr:CRISPR-associated protein Csx11 [Chloroflexota bacterium]
MPRLLILAHGEVSGQEKKGYTFDGEYAEVNLTDSTLAGLRVATAFGYEAADGLNWTEWPKLRASLLDRLPAVWNSPVEERVEFTRLAQEVLSQGLGDTERPINEISLWDYASAIAALFKAAVARAVLEGVIPSPAEMHWRLLAVRLDAQHFLFQAAQVVDLIARREVLERAQVAIQHAFEVTMPIGNAVYQDEDGLLFVVPDLPSRPPDEFRAALCDQVQHALRAQDEQDAAQGGNLMLSDALPHLAISEKRRGKRLNPQPLLRSPRFPARLSPETVGSWWKEAGEVCTACGLRPQGYIVSGLPGYVTAAKARERRICGVCLARRGRRSQQWANEQTGETIWVDEVADTNGRVALVVGSFDLDGWLDGTLVRTIGMGKAKNDPRLTLAKPPTFARIQRVWRTTLEFWQRVRAGMLKSLVDDRRRLMLKLDGQPDLGAYHVYDFDLDRTRLSVVWCPSKDGTSGYLLSADNLGRVARLLGAEPGIYNSPAAAAIFVEDYIRHKWVVGRRAPRLYNPDAALPPQENLLTGFVLQSVEFREEAYAPAIPILAEPRVFMALVPADKALDVTQAIRERYEREMGKVRNRLPLHLGLVFAPYRTPLRAILDAGRRMLAYRCPNGQPWEVLEDVQSRTSSDLPRDYQYLASGNQQFNKWYEVKLRRLGQTLQGASDVVWRVPAVMGDGATDDTWYPYVFIATNGDDARVQQRAHKLKGLRPTGDGSAEPCWLVHAGELRQGDTIYFTPATFDFEWLDTTSRRFEIAYDAAGRRLAVERHRRPYLLDDLGVIQRVGRTLSESLSQTQRHALRDIVEQKRQIWQPDQSDCERGGFFWQFCRDAIANAQWGPFGDPKTLPWDQPEWCERFPGNALPDQQKRYDAWLDTWAGYAASGLLADAFELFVEILKF